MGKTLYLECYSGISGDMTVGALLDLGAREEALREALGALPLKGYEITIGRTKKCGIDACDFDVILEEEAHEHHGGEAHAHEHEAEHCHDHSHDHPHTHGPEAHDHHHDHHHHHHHTGMHEIEHIIEHFDIPEKVRTDILAVYHLIAEAESHAHGCEIEQIHFHEVGQMDAVADITGVCMLINELGVDKIIASPIHVGCGQVQCAHGILPVPAPATAYILKDIPIYGGNVQGELCTPTGAALLAHFADEFGNMPVMRVSKIGYGMGAKDFETANCVRVMLGETESEAQQVLELKCNIDDMTAEEIGYATEQLLKLGAVDVFTVPIGMKKNRPGTLLSCICKTSDKETMVNAIFRYTSTIGIRQNICERYILDRTENTVKTKYGDVRVKQSEGYGVKRVKAEYDNVARIADELGISINETRRLIGEELEKNEQQV